MQPSRSDSMLHARRSSAPILPVITDKEEETRSRSSSFRRSLKKFVSPRTHRRSNSVASTFTSDLSGDESVYGSDTSIVTLNTDDSSKNQEIIRESRQRTKKTKNKKEKKTKKKVRKLQKYEQQLEDAPAVIQTFLRFQQDEYNEKIHEVYLKTMALQDRLDVLENAQPVPKPQRSDGYLKIELEEVSHVKPDLCCGCTIA